MMYDGWCMMGDGWWMMYNERCMVYLYDEKCNICDG